jgi:hypothetical protein
VVPRVLTFGGNASIMEDVFASPGKSYLFFVSRRVPGIGSPRERDIAGVKLHSSGAVRITREGP